MCNIFHETDNSGIYEQVLFVIIYAMFNRFYVVSY